MFPQPLSLLLLKLPVVETRETLCPSLCILPGDPRGDLVTDSHPIQGKKEWFPLQPWGNPVAHEHACLYLFLTNWPINRQKNVNIH